jgi:1-acyl-sn-glycerol-3-phosphate acyltransferase
VGQGRSPTRRIPLQASPRHSTFPNSDVLTEATPPLDLVEHPEIPRPFMSEHTVVSPYQAAKGALITLLIILNTVWWGGLILVFAPLKLYRNEAWRKRLAVMYMSWAHNWSWDNSWLLRKSRYPEVLLEVPEGLDPQKSYLVLSNHISMADVPVVEYACINRIPFRKIFIKQELIWLPIVGAVCWVLDFPFMKRYSKEKLKRNPSLKGKDLETTRKSCEKLKGRPSAILSYVEGTRFNERKRESTRSPYRHLLKPKVGGVLTVLQYLGEELDGVVDLTLVYPDNPQPPTFWELVTERVPRVIVRMRLLPVPFQGEQEAELSDTERVRYVRRWLDGIWKEKDEFIESQIAQRAVAA